MYIMKYKLVQNNPMGSQTFCEFGFPFTALGCGKIFSEISVKKKPRVHAYKTSKRIEQESPCWSEFEAL